MVDNLKLLSQKSSVFLSNFVPMMQRLPAAEQPPPPGALENKTKFDHYPCSIRKADYR